MGHDTITRKRGAVKFLFWTLLSVSLYGYAFYAYFNGQLVRWYYYTAEVDGYAVDAESFLNATKDNPALLTIGPYESIDGLQAVLVKEGERVPDNTNGIISLAELESGKRAVRDGGTAIKVFKPVEIKEQKGFKFKDTFKHKGIKTNPWAGVWNVAIVLLLGLSLGLMAEGFTDMLNWRLPKSEHGEFGH
jgi:hypothetical protein